MVIAKGEGRGTKAILFGTLIVAAVGFLTVAAAPSDPRVRVEPAQVDVPAGDDFEVRVMIDDVEDLGGFEIKIAYDPSVIELKDVAAGDFLGSTGRTTLPVGPEISQEEGTVAFGVLGLGGQAGPTGSGVLAIISGTAQKEGSSALSLEEIQVFNTAPEALSLQVEHGQVNVNGSNASPSASPGAPQRTIPWGWIVGGAVLALVAAAALILAVLRRKPREEPASDLD